MIREPCVITNSLMCLNHISLLPRYYYCNSPPSLFTQVEPVTLHTAWILLYESLELLRLLVPFVDSAFALSSRILYGKEQCLSDI